ncbi:hypothetical protein, partial [Propionispora vibrioides]|uniref:hypothetical protein n=1 Tax=Propionispora vibrioides TaxID=112903 RepID=UPI001C43596D
THDTGASTPSHIRIHLEAACCEPPLLRGKPHLQQTAIGLKLTSGSGEQTFYEATFRFNRRKKNFYLIDFSQLYHGHFQAD